MGCNKTRNTNNYLNQNKNYNKNSINITILTLFSIYKLLTKPIQVLAVVTLKLLIKLGIQIMGMYNL